MRSQLNNAIDLLRSGDPARVGEAIQLLQQTVYAFSMKVCGHREDAEDTMQDVLISSLPHLAKIENPRALAVWLYTVTRNRCWRTRRKESGGNAKALSLEELMPDNAELQRVLQDGAANPEQQVLRGEKDLLLHQAVLSLPTRYRIVLVLHDMESLDTAQVAQVLGLQPGTVRVRLHRARLGVRKAMAQLLNGMASVNPGEKVHPQSARQRLKQSPVSRSSGCREIFANLSEYLDDRLDAGACEEMREHILACPACVAFLRELSAAIDRCRNFEPSCDRDVATRLGKLLTTEYLRLIGHPV